MSTSIQRYYLCDGHTRVVFLRTGKTYEYESSELYELLQKAEGEGLSLGKTLNQYKKSNPKYRLIEEE